jgi:hypothetical protein
LLIAPVIENVHLINFYGVAYRFFSLCVAVDLCFSDKPQQMSPQKV